MKRIILTIVVTIFLVFSQTIPAFAENEMFTEQISLAATNSSASTALNINVNATYSDSCTSSSDVNWYKFSLPNSGYINMDFSHELNDGTYAGWDHWRVYFYNYNGDELMMMGSSGNKRVTTSSSLGIPAGVYYVKIVSYHSNVEGMHNNDSVYNFQVNYTQSANWEKELNGSFNTANQISVNTNIFGCNVSHSDLDYYTFNLFSSGLISVKFNHPYEEDYATWAHWYMTIYNYNGDVVLSEGFKGNQTSTTTKAVSLPSGQYYVKILSQHNNVNGWHNSTATYNFMIASHTHSYKDVITKATTSKNGKNVKTCSCGATNGTTTIYYPKTITLSATSYTYDGKVKKPSVTVKGSDGKVISSVNYTVSYGSGRKNVGTYKVSIKFKGNYSGTVSKTFKINPKATSLSKLTAKSKGFAVKWKKQTEQVSGYQIQYSTNKSFSSKATKTITKNSTTSATYKGLKAKKKYYVRIRTYKKVSGINYYSSWSSVKTVTTKK